MKHVVFNQKGGVGKSTIACKLAAIPVSQGIPWPMIHLDPRHKLSQEFVQLHARLEQPV